MHVHLRGQLEGGNGGGLGEGWSQHEGSAGRGPGRRGEPGLSSGVRSELEQQESGVFSRLLAERYIVEEVLGEGTHGCVYRGTDMITSEPVALKSFGTKASSRDTFLRELGVLFELDHPHLVRCRNMLVHGGRRWLVSELLEGGNLRERLEDAGCDVLRELRHVKEAALGLDHAHQRGIVHRDIKPENILLTRRGPLAMAKVGDFGVADWRHRLGSGTGVGSPAYMAPEQFHDVHDHRVDVYALGVILHELFAGERPFRGGASDVLSAQRQARPRPAAWLPERARELLTSCLAFEAEERPASASALAHELDAIRGELREGGALPAWPLATSDTRYLGIGERTVFLLEASGHLRRLDRYGRLIGEHRGIRQLAVSGQRWLVLDEHGWCWHHGAVARRLAGFSAAGFAQLGADGAVLQVNDGAASLYAKGQYQQLEATGSGVVGGTLCGPASDVCLVRRVGADGLLIKHGGHEVKLTGQLLAVHGHPRVRALIVQLRGASEELETHLFTPRGRLRVPAGVRSIGAPGPGPFIAATDEGQLLCMDPHTGRHARTGWDAGLTWAAQGQSLLAWINRAGQLKAVPCSTNMHSGR